MAAGPSQQPQGRAHGRNRGRGHQRGCECGRGGQGHGDRRGKNQDETKAKSLPTRAVPISKEDVKYSHPDDFCPLCNVGPHVPPGIQIDALVLFELFFNRMIIGRILHCMYAYAESKKDTKKGRYNLFMKRKVGIMHLYAFIGLTFWTAEERS